MMLVALIRSITHGPSLAKRKGDDITHTKRRLYEIKMEKEDLMAHYRALIGKEDVLQDRLERLTELQLE